MPTFWRWVLIGLAGVPLYNLSGPPQENIRLRQPVDPAHTDRGHLSRLIITALFVSNVKAKGQNFSQNSKVYIVILDRALWLMKVQG